VTNNTDTSPKEEYALRAFQENESLISLGWLPAIFWVAVDKILLRPVRVIEFNLRQKMAMIQII